MAVKTYKETVDILSKTSPGVQEICFKNLGDIKEVLFFAETPDEVARIVAADPSKLVPFYTLKKL